METRNEVFKIKYILLKIKFFDRNLPVCHGFNSDIMIFSKLF